MQRSKVFVSALALGIVAIMGASGMAFAYPLHHGAGAAALTQEQQAAAQELYTRYSQTVTPLQQQLMVKRAELNSLYYGQNADSGKTQALYRDIADIEAKLFTANKDFRNKLAEKGIPGAGYGPHMGYAGGHGHGGGHGMNREHGGHW